VAVSLAGLVLGPGGLAGANLPAATGVASSTAGVLVPGFLAHDVFNLLVALPVLLVTIWLARRGNFVALLLWPGGLFYLLYTYALYLVGTPFSALFLPYVALVVLSGCGVICLLVGIDSENVRQQLQSSVPARSIGGLLVGLGLLTLAQDAIGAVSTALAGSGPVDPLARHVWTVDLTLEVPAMVVGGVLLWRRKALGYLAGAGLLFQFGITPVALAIISAVQPVVDVATVSGLLLFATISFVPLLFFAQGVRRIDGRGLLGAARR
jgi:hypothetical protein